ncbi:MAG: MFS transporter [Myxococcales bacterium]|nr:MFS transporter [Myxococcales bacterium]
MELPFGVLRVRNFRLHFIGQTASNVGTWFQSLAQALLVLDLTGSGTALGLVTALQFAPTLVLAPYAGVLADRMSPRRLLVVTAGLAALLAGTLATVAALGHINVTWLYGMALALGCVQALDRPTAQTLLYELVGPDELKRAIGLHSVTQSSARMLGPGLAGAAYALLGPAACFAINAVSFLGVIVALMAMRRDALWPRPRTTRRAHLELRDALHQVAREPQLRAPLLVSALIGALTFNFMTTITAMVRFELDGDASALGAAHALNAVGAVLGSLLVASLASPSRGGLATVCAALAGAILINSLAPSLHAFLLWAPCFGLAVGAYQTAFLTAVQRAAPPAMLGRVSGLFTLGTVGMMPIASLVAGVAIDLWSARVAMGVGAAACLTGAAMLAWPLARAAAAARSA